MSFIGVPIVLAPVFGPTLGGLLLEHVGWQSIFLINVPVGIVAFIAGLRLLPHDSAGSEAAGRLDVIGLGARRGRHSSASPTGCRRANRPGACTAPSVLVPALGGLVLIAAVRAPRAGASLTRCST